MYFNNVQLSSLLSDSDVVIFDMNGLIIDDEPIQLNATNSVLKKYNISLTEKDWLEKCVGRKPLIFLSNLINEKYIPDIELNSIILLKDKEYENLMIDQIAKLTRPGFLEFLEYLKTKTKTKIALATSTTNSGTKLILGERGLNIIDSFDYIICGDDLKNSKPDPEIYLKVVDYFGKDLNYLVFEDTYFGIVSATNAGLKVIAVPNKFTINQNFDQAEYIIDSFCKESRIINT